MNTFISLFLITSTMALTASSVMAASTTVRSPLTYSATTNRLGLNTVPVLNGGTGVTTYSPYSLLYTYPFNGSVLLYSIIPGSAGQVLTHNGSSAYPSFQNFPDPGWRFVSKNSAYTVSTSTDNNTVFLLTGTTGSTLTITLPAAASATAGFKVVFKKMDRGPRPIIQINRSSSDTIDGATSYVFTQQYETVYMISDGSNWQVMSKFIPLNGVKVGQSLPGILPNCTTTFQVPNYNFYCDATATGSNDRVFTVPAGVTLINVSTWGAGGAGKYVSGTCSNGGGGGGAYAEMLIPTTPGTSYKYNVGAGGVYNVLVNGANGNGGNTCFGGSVTACTLPVVLAQGGKGDGTGGTIVGASAGTIAFTGGNGTNGGGSAGGNNGNGAANVGATGGLGSRGDQSNGSSATLGPSYRDSGGGGVGYTSGGCTCGGNGGLPGGGGGTSGASSGGNPCPGAGGVGAITIQW